MIRIIIGKNPFQVSLPQQFQQASNSPASASIIRTLPAEQCSYALNNKVTRPFPSPTFKDKGNVLGNIGCNQADSRSQFSCSDFTEHFRGASKPGIRISQSPNNSGELPYTESGKKLKDQISSFSSYEKGSTSNSVTQDTCVATDITHNADKSFICMNCYKFLTEIAEKTSGLSALLPTNQVYELPHNPSAKTRRSAGSSYLQISVYIQEEELPGVFLRLFRRRIRCQWICFCYLGLVYQWRWDSFMEVVDFQQIYLYVMVTLLCIFF
ncbi:uncharacterized protein [Coffea arabica]|uniref:Uncharacterized protein n=1 Tax=Coffea arabica TaxID=13443 RepID=A0ABM4W760_COFAR